MQDDTISADAKAGHRAVRRCLASRDWGGVLYTAQLLLARAPCDPVLLVACHKAYVALQDRVNARSTIERAIACDGKNPSLHHLHSLLEQQCGDTIAAREATQRALALAPAAAEHLARLGSLSFQLGDYADAVAALEAALALEPGRDRWWNTLALCAMQRDDLGRAVQAFERALAIREDLGTRAALQESRRLLDATLARGYTVRSASPTYYDEVFAESPKFLKAGTDSDYLPVWRRIADLLAQGGFARVLDLGCGPGQFGEYIAQSMPGIDYAGIDFSAEAVVQARRRCPQFRFEQAKLPDPALVQAIPNDVVLCTEVLEHVDEDIEILRSIPPGKAVIASVPNYDSFSHVRSFKTETAVRQRYGPWLAGLEIERIQMTISNVIWLFHGRR